MVLLNMVDSPWPQCYSDHMASDPATLEVKMARLFPRVKFDCEAADPVM